MGAGGLVARRCVAMADHLPPDGLDATYLPNVAESGNDWRKSAGDFACTACGKKRLTAMSFSKSQVGSSLGVLLSVEICLARLDACALLDPGQKDASPTQGWRGAERPVP